MVFLAGDDDDVLAGAELSETVESGLKHRPPGTQHVEELLGVVALADGPESAAEAASHDYAVVVGVHWYLYADFPQS